MALTNANYEFMYANAGVEGKTAEGGGEGGVGNSMNSPRPSQLNA